MNCQPGRMRATCLDTLWPQFLLFLVMWWEHEVLNTLPKMTETCAVWTNIQAKQQRFPPPVLDMMSSKWSQQSGTNSDLRVKARKNDNSNRPTYLINEIPSPTIVNWHTHMNSLQKQYITKSHSSKKESTCKEPGLQDLHVSNLCFTIYSVTDSKLPVQNLRSIKMRLPIFATLWLEKKKKNQQKKKQKKNQKNTFWVCFLEDGHWWVQKIS